jgi:hypothetical protein
MESHFEKIMKAFLLDLNHHLPFRDLVVDLLSK